jgi:putative transposase
MWTDTTWALYARAELALPSDLTDAQWALLEPFFRCLAVWDERANGRCGGLSRRSAYLLRGGLPWRMLPPCFPPVSTLRRWFSLWRDNGLWLSLRAVCDLIASDRPLYLFDLAHFPNRRVIRPGWKTL